MDRYTSVDDLKTKLCEQFSEYTEGCETQFGYVVPGHGMKGKQEKISTDEQLAVMYEKHKKKKRILLWLKCIPKSKKRASTQGDAPQSKRHASLKLKSCVCGESAPSCTGLQNTASSAAPFRFASGNLRTFGAACRPVQWLHQLKVHMKRKF